ncbi:MAG: FAD-dependent monooxygenase [Bacteroidetes bacterium]|nr:MAG: FAD-dependent monooxygenase [Bacteroidota bacterium]
MKTINILGAGLVGSLLAIYMAKRGFSVNVYENRSDLRKNLHLQGKSINLALSDRGWKALETVDVADAIKKIAIPMHGRMIHNLNGTLNFQPYGTENQCIYSVSRSDLNRVLLNEAEKMENVHLFFDSVCEKVDLKANKFWIRNTKNKQIQEIENTLTFGADGAFSALRLAMQRTDRYTYSQSYLPDGYKELLIPAGKNGEFLLEKNALHICPRGKFMLIALPNFDGSFTCTLFLSFESGEHHFANLTTEKAVLDFMQTHFPDISALIPNLCEQFFQNPTGAMLTVRASSWVYENRFALIGDAAHAIVPFYGQGMNAGFEDCRILNELLDKYSENLEQVFTDYQAVRIKDSAAIADLALNNFVEMRDKTADPKFLLQKKIEAKIHQLFPKKWLPLYSMVTFSHIPYSEAQKIGFEQEEIMQKIMQIPDIENSWESLDFENILFATK